MYCITFVTSVVIMSSGTYLGEESREQRTSAVESQQRTLSVLVTETLEERRDARTPRTMHEVHVLCIVTLLDTLHLLLHLQIKCNHCGKFVRNITLHLAVCETRIAEACDVDAARLWHKGTDVEKLVVESPPLQKPLFTKRNFALPVVRKVTSSIASPCMFVTAESIAF